VSFQIIDKKEKEKNNDTKQSTSSHSTIDKPRLIRQEDNGGIFTFIYLKKRKKVANCE